MTPLIPENSSSPVTPDSSAKKQRTLDGTDANPESVKATGQMERIVQRTPTDCVRGNSPVVRASSETPSPSAQTDDQIALQATRDWFGVTLDEARNSNYCPFQNIILAAITKAKAGHDKLQEAFEWLRDTGAFFERCNSTSCWQVIDRAGTVLAVNDSSIRAVLEAKAVREEKEQTQQTSGLKEPSADNVEAVLQKGP